MQDLVPIWDALGKEFEGDDEVIIAKLDATRVLRRAANDVPHQGSSRTKPSNSTHSDSFRRSHHAVPAAAAVPAVPAGACAHPHAANDVPHKGMRVNAFPTLFFIRKDGKGGCLGPESGLGGRGGVGGRLLPGGGGWLVAAFIRRDGKGGRCLRPESGLGGPHSPGSWYWRA